MCLEDLIRLGLTKPGNAVKFGALLRRLAFVKSRDCKASASQRFLSADNRERSIHEVLHSSCLSELERLTVPAQPIASQADCPNQGSKTNKDPRFTPRIAPEPGSHLFVLLSNVDSEALNKFCPFRATIVLSTPGNQAATGVSKTTKIADGKCIMEDRFPLRWMRRNPYTPNLMWVIYHNSTPPSERNLRSRVKIWRYPAVIDTVGISPRMDNTFT